MPALLLIAATAAAAVMGFAIQRGATCMVAAIEEVVTERRASRLIALAEAALWVMAGIAVASLAGVPVTLPARDAGLHAVVGGVLLGVGAFLNRACVFGSIARLGSGEWAYLATPAGFFLGCLVASPFLAAPAISSPVWIVPTVVVAALALPLLLLRTVRLVGAGRVGMIADHVWSPHLATAIIGIAFIFLLIAVGPWTYTEALAAAARGMHVMSGATLLLFAGLFGGALLGGAPPGGDLGHPRPAHHGAVGRQPGQSGGQDQRRRSRRH